MKNLLPVIPLALACTTVAAENISFEICHSETSSEARLACYDEVTSYQSNIDTTANSEQSNAAINEEPSPPEGDQWQFTNESSALDNRTDVWLNVQSANTEGNAIGSPIKATLWIRCMENKTNVLIGFDRYTTDDQNVKFKLDDGSVDSQWMETMRGGDGIGIWSGSRAIPFIKGMFNKEMLVIAYKTYTGPVEFTFDVSGLRNRITPLAEACQWSP